LKATRQEVLDQLQQDGIKAVARAATATAIRIEGRVRIVDHLLYRQGQVEIQDEASQIAVAASGALPGQTVVDFGAGAGGKSLALASLMENQGQIYALDVSSLRLKRLMPRATRAGVEIISPVQIGDTDDDPWLASHHNIADLVFLDAPCSGTGTWRRQVEQRLRLTPEILQGYIDLQAQVMARAWGLVKPGGMFAYATCSILLDENELQVRRFLAEKSDAEMVAGSELLLTPARSESDGFFLAMIRKSA
jgi:16S rRNA (cytosine967-C5)-methyltransferase